MPHDQQPSREPLVLLPGMMCDGRIFDTQIRTFSGSMPVMVLPLAGGDTVEKIAARMLSHLPPRFALAGLSMGGILAMELVRRAPERISRLCLMGASPLAETPEQAADREPQIIAARAGRLEDVLRAALPMEALAPGPSRLEVHNLFCHMGMELGPELYVAQARALQRRPDQQATMRRVHMPTLVLSGEHDTIVPPAKQELLAQLIPHARLEVIPEAGHFPVLEAPDAVNRALLHWLAVPA
ncbi:alpha/beta fold hydrolase [Leisingera caerulea]|uniref:Alpha/beta hydrolase n=1 Tax=Leisingera caerulea TaxID=506591 RepID=A0A9Q9LXQ9_LEICA|nr:alpha/beta hydrolase [Leisingera caerulea]UWQ51066.1 alpha/beta hydrolase [Leisingera caerulea]UWQ55145.1 alpha/beta hydrolase [Leisingera caerulea]UWQ84815.1 alpha/beta hydrolase [Leisingera caerulea]